MHFKENSKAKHIAGSQALHQPIGIDVTETLEKNQIDGLLMKWIM